jgi:hypothetical protein
MHCTKQEIKEYINLLKEKVDDIEKNVTNLQSALDTTPNLSVLIKRGIHSFLADIYADITRYKSLSTEIEKFNISDFKG